MEFPRVSPAESRKPPPDRNDEPTFVLRATNPAMTPLLRRYAKMLKRAGATDEQVRPILDLAERAGRWNGYYGRDLDIEDPLGTGS